VLITPLVLGIVLAIVTVAYIAFIALAVRGASQPQDEEPPSTTAAPESVAASSSHDQTS
jgi:hypothetical protein